jgi:hypothetical protein
LIQLVNFASAALAKQAKPPRAETEEAIAAERKAKPWKA